MPLTSDDWVSERAASDLFYLHLAAAAGLTFFLSFRFFAAAADRAALDFVARVKYDGPRSPDVLDVGADFSSC